MLWLLVKTAVSLAGILGLNYRSVKFRFSGDIPGQYAIFGKRSFPHLVALRLPISDYSKEGIDASNG
jgi:hypothetical protein